MSKRIAHQERTDLPRDRAKAQGRTGVNLWIKNRSIQFKVVPQCRVCQCSDRALIEHGLMIGYGYQAIVKSLPDHCELRKSRDGKTTFDIARVARLIGDHSRNGHAHADAAITRAIQEEWAKKAGLDIDTVTTSIVTEFGLLNEVMRRAWQNMLESDELPTLNQGMRAAELMLNYQDIGSDVDANVFREAVEALFRVLRSKFDDNTVQQIFLMMQEDPAITAAFAALQAVN